MPSLPVLFVLLPLVGADLRTPLRVDLNPANGRGDILTRGWDNWAVEGPSPSRNFGTLTVTLKASKPLAVRWYKPLLVQGATLTSDGVAATDSLEIVIDGLAPGRHSLAAYHNLVTDTPSGLYDIDVDDRPTASRLRPTSKVHNDNDAACSYVEFTASEAPVVLTFKSPGHEVIVNGFEIDTEDPNRRAIKPSPPHDDEHADADSGDLALGWSTRNRTTSTSYDLYLGADRQAVAAAGRSAPEFRGNQRTASYLANGLSDHGDRFWRVDVIDGAGNATRGDVWHFRPRHLAFPGAEGHGRFAQGGRGGRVIEVTNLNDAGPGSFRAAVDSEGPRTVVFRVSGVIRLASPITITRPYLTVAGQTAPGDGICFRGYPVGSSAGSRDIILRFLRVRPGDEAGRSLDGIGLGGDHTIIDHCSISWSIDEGLDSRTARNSTFQRCLISEALDDSFQRHPHGFGASIGGEYVSYHHNLLAHCTGRVWSLAGGLDNAVHFAGRLDIRNNVVYNWRHRTTDGGAKLVNFVNNYYKPGPASQVFHLLKPDVGRPGDRQVYYVTGNLMEGHPEHEGDNWARIRPNGPAPLAEIKSDTPLFPAYVRTTSALDAFEDVLADVGAVLPSQDAIDRRILREVRTGTFTYKGSKGQHPGIIDSPHDLGPNPWPEYKTYDVPADSDHDGLPDAWEQARHLNPHSTPGDFSDANADPDGDGYTCLEDYLNDLAARRPARD